MQITKDVLEDYERYMIRQELSVSTIKSYMWTATYFSEHYPAVSKHNLMLYKEYLKANYKPHTVNTRIYAINHFLVYINRRSLLLKTVRIQQRTFLDNVISNAEYKRFLRALKNDGHIKYYMIVHTLACTGARISELLQFRIEDVSEGYLDIYAKGGKLRRIYFPKYLREELMEWAAQENRESGALFLNKNGITISARGVEQMLKKYADQYKINPEVVHPHSFRHRFALNFLKNKPKEIIALADLMGHSNLNTTRIYTRRTAQEQFALVNSTVDW